MRLWIISSWPPVACAVAFLIFLTPSPFAAPALLADAAQQLDHATIRSLLAEKADVNAEQVDGMTALHWAVYKDDLEMARLLVKAGADVNATNHYGVFPLSLACQNGNTEIVKLLLNAGADPNAALRGGETVLMTASRTGVPGCVEALLSRNASVNAKDRRGQTPIMWASAEGNRKTVELLMRAGADFETPLDSGFTPFFFAVRQGHQNVVQLFLDKGVDVNATMNPRRTSGRGVRRGTSALILAIENGHFQLANLLLEAGADPNDARTGFTPLHTMTWVRKPNRGDGDNDLPPPEGSGNIGSLEFVRLLVAHGANVNARLHAGKTGRGELGRDGETPFLMAADTADVPLMKLLVELGADPLLPNSDGATPLMAAAGLGTLAPGEEAGTEEELYDAVELALKLGNDINATDKNGETAMHGAAYKSAPKIVQLLADRGAKPEIWNRKNKWGWTPLDIAEGYRPGNFRPSAETIAALHHVLLAQNFSPNKSPAPSTNSPAAKELRQTASARQASN